MTTGFNLCCAVFVTLIVDVRNDHLPVYQYMNRFVLKVNIFKTSVFEYQPSTFENTISKRGFVRETNGLSKPARKAGEDLP